MKVFDSIEDQSVVQLAEVDPELKYSKWYEMVLQLPEKTKLARQDRVEVL